MADWPSTLWMNVEPLLSPESNVIRSSTSVGPAKVRLRYTANPAMFKGTLMCMNRNEYTTFIFFFRQTIAHGSKRFNMIDGESGTTNEWRIIPPYNDTALLAIDGVTQKARIDLTLERL